ncbi:MAG TPA: UvrB/UvrC motif-containing protein [Caulobacter sp.]|nr:UvrB/UvrC motif-containing protein [Caulobacter sp.]
MTATRDLLATLEAEMNRAAASGDHERADLLRDRLRALKDGQASYLRPQRAGAMGLGTSDEVPKRPAGWKPPPRPDPLTARRK